MVRSRQPPRWNPGSGLAGEQARGLVERLLMGNIALVRGWEYGGGASGCRSRGRRGCAGSRCRRLRCSGRWLDRTMAYSPLNTGLGSVRSRFADIRDTRNRRPTSTSLAPPRSDPPPLTAPSPGRPAPSRCRHAVSLPPSGCLMRPAYRAEHPWSPAGRHCSPDRKVVPCPAMCYRGRALREPIASLPRSRILLWGLGHH